MNETITTLSGLPEELKQFANLFIEKVKSKHKRNVCDCVDIPLERIPIRIEEFTASPGEIPGINLHDKPELVVSTFIGELCNAVLIEPADGGGYKLIKHRLLYNCLRKKLGNTP